MPKKIISREVYKFYKGRVYHLDHIYAVSGLCGGNWWTWHWLDGTNGEEPEDRQPGERLAEEVYVLRDIIITITEQ
jgi:hypothetical protein